MFYICQVPNHTDDAFILYDKKEFNPDEFQLIKVKEISFEELISDYKKLPILQLNEFILRIFNPKKRTTTHILGENHIDCWAQIENEYNLIQSKQSKLSKTQRDKVIERYNEIINV